MEGRYGDPPAAEIDIWLACAMEPRSGRYNVVIDLEFDGPLRLDEVRAALATVIRRHAALRTRFAVRDGRLCREPTTAAARCAEFAHAEPYDRAAALAATTALVAQPLEPGHGPLVRAIVSRYPGATLLTLVTHHIVTDGRSVEILYRDVIDALGKQRRGGDREPDDGEPGDRATGDGEPGDRSQSTVDGRADGEAARRHWTTLLSGAPEPIGWAPGAPTDAMTPGPPPSGVGVPALRELDVAEPVRRALCGVATRLRASPAIVLLTAWTALLCAEAGVRDGVIGMPFGTRMSERDFDTVGMYARMLPVRLRFAGDEPVRDVIVRVRDQVLASMGYAGDEPVGRSGRLRYRATYVHEPRYEGSWVLPGGCAARVIGRVLPAAKYPIGLATFDGCDGLTLRVDYDADRCRETAVAGLLDRLGALLAAIATRSDAMTMGDLLGDADAGGVRGRQPEVVTDAW